MNECDSTMDMFFAGELSPELVRLLDATVTRLSSSRRTFTEAEALSDIWKAGYEVSPQIDPRFALACEADGKHLRHWRLASQVLANNLLADALAMGAWDGRDLDRELAHLSEVDGLHYVFCPVDSRFLERPDGIWDLAQREPEVSLPSAIKAELDGLGPALHARWVSAGAAPWAVRQVTETLTALGWTDADKRGSWTLVRAWLRQWPDVVRVGQAYWALANHLPRAPAQTRLHVMPVSSKPGHAPAETGSRPDGADPERSTSSLSETPSLPEGVLVPSQAEVPGIAAAWTVALRTIELVEGFLPVPAAARKAYPPRAVGMATWEVLRGKWYDTNDDLWIWLDRDHNRLFGPDLADKLAWCEAGQRVRVEWTQDALILRLLDVDVDVQHEETRLVDIEALAELRGGLGESYRHSIQAILGAAPSGLAFQELVEAVRARQGHVVHRGTIRAILSTGGFIHRDGRWFAAPDPSAGARALRKAVTQALAVPRSATESAVEATERPNLATTIRAIHYRLHELRRKLARSP